MSISTSHDIAVIDTQVDDYQSLVDAAQAQGMEIILLSGDDGLEELAAALSDETEIDSLHLFTHGSQGSVQVGDDTLNSESLSNYTAELAIIQASLSEEGDILLYGCNVAEGEAGEGFIEQLALVTGADIAASDDLTGNSELGGDWELEVLRGNLDISPVEVSLFDGTLGDLTFTNSGYWNSTGSAYSYGSTLFYLTGDSVYFYESQYSGSVFFSSIGSSIGNNVDAYIYLKGGATFNLASVDIQTWDGNTTTQSTLTFTPSTGTAVEFVSAENQYHNVTLNFTGITGFRVTAGSTTTDLYLLNMNGVTVGAANTAPTISNVTSSAQSVNDNATLNPFSTVTIGDDDGDNVTVSIQLDQNYGSFSNYEAQGFTYDSDTLTYSLTSRATSDAEAAIQALVFDPRENSITSGSTETTTFTITVNDGTAADVTNSDTQVTTTSVNDAPTDISLSSTSINQSAGTDGTVGTLSSTDADANESFTYTLVSGTGSTDNGSFNISGDTLRADDASGLTEGTYDIRIETNDGDTTYEKEFTITVVDDVAPTVTAGNISISGGTGTGGAFQIGDTVTATWDNSAAGDNNSDTISSVTVDFSEFGAGTEVAATEDSGVWTATYDIVSGTISSTSANVSITAKDDASNATTTAGTNNVTVDNQAPDAPASLDLDAGSDTGSSSTDNVTNDTTPTISGTSEANASITLYDTDSSTVLGTTTANGSGAWSITSSTLAEGSHTLTAKAVDSVGNESSASTGLSITVDTTAPTISSATLTDQAYKVDDEIIVTIQAGETGLSLASGGTVNGVAVTDFTDAGGGGYTVKYTVQDGDTDVAAGDDIAVSIALTDAAGNTSTTYTTAISQGSDSIDANLPEVSSIVASTTEITDTTAFTLTVTFDEDMNQSVAPTISFPNDALSNTLAFSSGLWTSATTYVASYSVTDNDEVIRDIDVQVSGAEDTAGNALTTVTDNDIFDVITAPAPTITSISSTDSDGTYKVDDTINITVTFDEAVTYSAGSGSIEATLSNGATVALSVSVSNSTEFSGTYTVEEGDTDSSDLSVSSIALTGDATLEADDDAVPASFSLPSGQNLADNKNIVVDANTPTSSAPILASASDSGVSSSDEITNDTTPTINGTVEANATVSVRVGGSEVDTTTADGSGDWSYTFADDDLTEGSNAITIVVSDAAGNESAASSVLSITLDDTDPTANNDTATVSEDAGETTLTAINGSSSTLQANDTDVSTTTAVYAVAGQTTNVGQSVAGSNGGLFTVNADGSVSFDPNDEFDSLDDSDTDTTSITVTVQDEAGNTADSTLTVTVNGANDAPTAADATKSVSYNGTYTFQESDFSFNDVDTGDTLDHITIESLPSAGTLTLNGGALTDSDIPVEVSKSELDAGKLTFTPESGSTGSGYASFTFTVSDGDDDSTSSNTITIDVGSRPSTTTPSTSTETTVVDGATVTQTSQTNSQGNTVVTITVDPVSSNREDTDSSTDNADVPLHYANGDSTQVVTTVSLPTGIGITARANSTASEQNTREDLISLIQSSASSESDEQVMEDAGNAFVDALNDSDEELWVNQVVLTSDSDTASSSAIRITGSSSSSYKEALVIDVTALPAGTILDLEDIEFAVIIGDGVIVRGGAGANIVYAGNDSQSIVLGAEDDELHGGDGDDTIGSKGGDDLLYGDSGDDLVVGGTGDDTLYGGTGNDVLQGGQSIQGSATFYLNDEGEIVTSFTPEDSDLSDTDSFSFYGDWYSQASLLLDGAVYALDLSEDNLSSVQETGLMLQATSEYAFLAVDTDRLKMIATSYQSIFGQRISADDLSTFATSDSSFSELAAIGYQAWLSTQDTTFAELTTEAKITLLYQSFWQTSDITEAIIADAVSQLTDGAWEDLFLTLAVSDQALSSLLNDQEQIQLTLESTLDEGALSTDMGDDTLYGGDGDDTLIGGHGSDLLDGGAGTDTAIQQHNFAEYSIEQLEDGSVTLTYQQDAYIEIDTLIGIEWVQFSDQLISIDNLL